MGTDIHGWIEFQSTGVWWAFADVGNLLPRNSGMFGLLFGVRDIYGFKPIVPIRDIPKDASDLVTAQYLEYSDFHDPTWITYTEVNGIDWDEEVTSIQVYRYGAWKFHSNVKQRGEVEWESEGYGKPYEKDGDKYRVVKVKRRLFQTKEWVFVFKWMDDLASLFETDNVRFVAWFDS